MSDAATKFLTGRAARQRSATARPALPVVTIAIAMIAIVVGVPSMLQFDRALVLHGQLWRLVSCHLTHWSVEHLLWDLLVFAALGCMCERADRRAFVATFVVGAIAISMSLFALPLDTYRGLSGIDSALFGLFAIQQRRFAPIFLIAFIAKTIFELATGHAIFVHSAASGFVPVPLAHLVGAAVGVLVGLLRSRTAATIARR